jgi:predicted AAA+ superfamily ATPase
MGPNMQRFRSLSQRLGALSGAHLVLLTGAHQTGKTSLARSVYPDRRVVDLDDPGQREELRALPVEEWAAAVGPAILDEIQEEPHLFATVKAAFDAGQVQQTVLIRSPRALGLHPVRETLDSRAFVCELFPLMASELAHAAAGAPPPPLLDRLLQEKGRADDLLAALPRERYGDTARAAREAIDHLLRWGGMPALLHLPTEKRDPWLRSYDAACLKRDPGDLTRRELLAFRSFQRLCAACTGRPLSIAELARQSGISIDDSRRSLEALSASCQEFLLPPYPEHLTGPVVKTPKIHWADLGLWRHLTGHRGEVTAPMFETLVVAEVHKWIRTTGLPVDLASYRTRSGLEVDLLLSTPHGVWGVEVKAGPKIGAADWRALRRVGEALGDRWRGGLVISQGARIEQLDQDVWTMPVDRLLV